MKVKTYLAQWRNPDAERRYRDLDASLWQRDLTGPPPEKIDVSTTFGTTRAYRWPGNGPPAILLHGMGDTAIRWIPYAERLGDYDVYAIDIMGDVGASTPTVGFASAADYPDWLGQSVSGLGLDRPTVVGHSLGGYIALSYAMTGAAASTLAFDPVGIVKLRLARFMAQGAGGLIAHVSPDRIRRLLADRLHQPLLVDRPGLKLFIHGQRHHPPKTPPLPVFTDDEMASINGPLLVLAGGRTSLFDTEHLMRRVHTLTTGGDARLIEGAGHTLTMTHFDECLSAVRSALHPTTNG